MIRQSLPRRDDAADVDDPVHARVARGGCDAGGRQGVESDEVRPVHRRWMDLCQWVVGNSRMRAVDKTGPRKERRSITRSGYGHWSSTTRRWCNSACRSRSLLLTNHPDSVPPIFFGGSSEAGAAITARYAGTYLTWGEPLSAVSNKLEWVRSLVADHGRVLSSGLRIHVISRDTA
jgi:hypothetical protein